MNLLCFTSAKGGVGTSLTVACVAYELARLGRKCLTADLHGGCRTLDLYMGADGDFVFDLHDVISGRCHIRDAIVSTEWGTDFISCSQSCGYTDADYNSIWELFKESCSEYDYVLADCPCSFINSQMATECHKLIAVTGCDAASVRCTEKLMLDITAKAEKYLVINNIVPELVKGGYHINVDDICDLCGAPPLGLIPHEPLAAVYGSAVKLLQNSSLRISAAFANVAKRLDNSSVCAVDFDYKTHYYKSLKKISRR